MQDFRKLRVWHLSQHVADKIYKVTLGFPKSQEKGLTDQMRRAADSVTSNIAEGCGRMKPADKICFWLVALGSTNELDIDLVRAKRQNLILPVDLQPLHKDVIDVRKMMVSLIQTTQASASFSPDSLPSKPPPPDPPPNPSGG